VGSSCGVPPLELEHTSLEQDEERGTETLTSILSKKKNCDVHKRPGSPGARQVSCVSREEGAGMLGVR
jgi:hypothetical protein